MKKLLLVTSMLALLVLSASSICSYADGYVAHVLSSPVGSYASAFDINNSGQIVGGINGGDPYAQRAILWNSYSSSPQSLDEGNRSAHARLINNSGLVVGEHESPPGYIMPFKWSAATGVTNINPPIVPEAVNETGTMVGWTQSPDAQQVPVMVSNTDHLTYLDVTPGDCGEAYDINDAGYIVGDLYGPGWGGHAIALWHEGNAPMNLGTFGGTWSTAFAINNAGQVLGFYGNDAGGIGGFVWSQGNDTIFIPSCPLFDYGMFGPMDINDNGVVLGGAEINGVHTIVTWSQAGGFTIVGTGIANAINNSGWIVGAYDLNDPQAIVWEPVSEPSSLFSLACLLPMAAGLLRKRRR